MKQPKYRKQRKSIADDFSYPAGTREEERARKSQRPVERVAKPATAEINNTVAGVLLAAPTAKNVSAVAFMAEHPQELNDSGLAAARKALDSVWVFPLDRATLITVIVLAYLSGSQDAER